jgi:tetratricopeptide (TPR) repeat protein
MARKLLPALLMAACLLSAPLTADAAGNNLQQLLQLGADALKAGNSLLATQKYQEAVQQNPNSHQAWYRLAEAQYKSKSYRAAIKSASKAIELAPENQRLLARYYSGRAWACFQAGLYGQAVRDMESATEMDPDKKIYQRWLNGARQKEQQKGPGPSLSSVLGYDERPRTMGGSSDTDRGQDRDSEQNYREDERESEQEYREEERAGEREDEREERYQDERESEREDPGDDRDRGQYEDESDRGSSADSGDDSADVIGGLSSGCRKSYFVCMAGCADIDSAGSRVICENACLSAAKSCH